MPKLIQTDILLYVFLIILGLGGIVFPLIWPQTIGFYLLTACASLAGLGVTFNIYYSKRFKEHLACPTGSDCNAVVNSKYAKFLGIPLEYMGMVYYSFILISYLGFIFAPAIKTTLWFPLAILMTFSAFIFSIYLLVIQAFILKKWCIWCLLSAALSIGIFLASLASLEFSGPVLTNVFPALLLLKSFGFALGVGGSVSSLFLFFKFLKDRQIDDKEAFVFEHISELIWLGVGIIFVSSLGFFATIPDAFMQSGALVIQMIAMIITFISGAILNVMFVPFISVMPFKIGVNESMRSLTSLRKGLVLSGSVAITSLLFAFVLDHVPTTDSLDALLVLYITIVLIAMSVGLTIDRKLATQKTTAEN
jgi:uncharacterized membrane protein